MARSCPTTTHWLRKSEPMSKTAAVGRHAARDEIRAVVARDEEHALEEHVTQ